MLALLRLRRASHPAQPGLQTAACSFALIRAANALHPDSGAWAFFMREIVKLPRRMTPEVFRAIRRQEWALAPDPLASVRSQALLLAGRPPIAELCAAGLRINQA